MRRSRKDLPKVQGSSFFDELSLSGNQVIVERRIQAADIGKLIAPENFDYLMSLRLVTERVGKRRSPSSYYVITVPLASKIDMQLTGMDLTDENPTDETISNN